MLQLCALYFTLLRVGPEQTSILLSTKFMTKLGMKCPQNITCFQFMLDWLQLRLRKLFVFNSIFSFRVLADLLYEQFSLQDSNVGSFLYVAMSTNSC